MTIVALDFVSRRIATLEGAPGTATTFGPTLTSLIYPIEVTHSLDVSTGMAWGALGDPVGELDVSSSWVSGALNATIEYESASASDGLDLTSSWVSGTLTATIEYETTSASDGLDSSSSWVSGTLTVVINYIHHADSATDEGLDVSSSWVSGTLT